MTSFNPQIQLPTPEPLVEWCPDKLNMLVYGPSGTGKSIFTSTWPRPILYIDTDNGMLSIATHVKPLDGIVRVELSDKSQDKHINFPVGWITVKQILTMIHDSSEYFGTIPLTVVLDSITTASRYAMTYTQFNNKRLGQRPVLQDWGDQMAEILEIINMGIALKCNFICVAHEQYQKDELSGRIWCLPLTTGKLAGQISLYFDEVYHAKTGMSGTSTTYLLETKASGLVTAKSRLDLPNPIPATYKEIDKVLSVLRARKGGSATQTPNTQTPTPTSATKAPAQSTQATQQQPGSHSWIAQV